MSKNIGKWMKRLLVVIIIIIVAKFYLAQNSDPYQVPGYDPADSLAPVYPTHMLSDEDQLVNTVVSRYHYKKFDLNDSLSGVIWDKFLNTLDHNRMYFTNSDIISFENFKTSLDDDIKDGNVNPAYEIFNTYKKRVNERTDYSEELLKKEFNFTKDENLLVDRKDAPWSKTDSAYNDLWRKKVKNDALGLLLTGEKWDDIQKKLQKRYENFRRAINQYESEDVFQLYMNSYTESIDPHTNYFSPMSSANFKINMSLSLEGIGAQLQTEDEYTKVLDIIPGGPAYKSGLLHRGDKIIGVAQGDTGEIVDVIGWRITDVVQLIRGPKGTTVRLQIIPSDQPANQPPEVIKLVRDKVKLEGQASKDTVLNVQDGSKAFKIGVITVPAFYIDFEAEQKGDKDYKSSTRDVRRLLAGLKKQNVDGVIIDLRNDGGGSLQEAIEMAGLFIKQGPIVQVKNANGKIDVDRDPDPREVYSGPMAVLVNRFSASASEIFAAALQDYGRAIILGEQTYGKGTVQNMVDLNRLLRSDDDKLGQVKITIAKFYRINGGSTQDKGVTPDISFPSIIDPTEYGESTSPSALKWDQIKPAEYQTYGDIKKLVPELEKKHKERIEKSTAFDNILEDIEEYNEDNSQQYVSLNEETRKKEKEQLEDKRLQRENERRKNKGLKLLNKGEKINLDHTDDKPELLESAKILADMITMTVG
jgi:carboxyl-terminal processing protease